MSNEEDKIRHVLRYQKGITEDLEIDHSGYDPDTWEVEGLQSHSHWKAKKKEGQWEIEER